MIYRGRPRYCATSMTLVFQITHKRHILEMVLHDPCRRSPVIRERPLPGTNRGPDARERRVSKQRINGPCERFRRTLPRD